MAYSTISKPSLYFNTKLYTGNGSTNAITGVGFQPDWTWIKDRDATDWHFLTDAVRGATKTLSSNANNAETTQATALTAFGSDGFTVGSDGSVNRNSENFVSWNWKANGAGSSNSNGSITSSVSANTTAGFSIVSWTGNSGTVGHGLGVKPAMIIVKSRQTANNWVVIHQGLTGGMDTNILVLNTNGAESSGGSGMAEPTSSVFTITSGLASNDNNIGYVFAEKKGYSKFGSYTGNGNSNGVFIYTGFKPAWVMVKKSNSTSNWSILDNKRLGFNSSVSPREVYANSNDQEYDSNRFDIISNGFKLRTSGGDGNGSGDTYIYMAFAEEPLVANVGASIPATAI